MAQPKKSWADLQDEDEEWQELDRRTFPPAPAPEETEETPEQFLSDEWEARMWYQAEVHAPRPFHIPQLETDLEAVVEEPEQEDHFLIFYEIISTEIVEEPEQDDDDKSAQMVPKQAFWGEVAAYMQKLGKACDALWWFCPSSDCREGFCRQGPSSWNLKKACLNDELLPTASQNLLLRLQAESILDQGHWGQHRELSCSGVVVLPEAWLP